ncbi:MULTISPECIES: malate synthase G [Streptomyces]|uniref:Malate synthase G n=1 Tax=Streptomyces eurythermus TaxID=42237 RepID=A0ABW6YYA6_9ACTN|nr:MULTISPECIES: malate synthase G [Streptomyces]QIS73909.1 malate synthase G [Streptomyces sp. DSM 40868]
MSIADVAADARVRIGSLRVARAFRDFVELEALPGTGVAAGEFWAGFERLIADLAPRDRALLARRRELQDSVDAWHTEHRGEDFDADAYRRHLTEIGYLAATPEPFTVDTTGTDAEITRIAGPQLLVPVVDEDFAIEGVNARWGSLYRALYDTDVIPPGDAAERRKAVIDFARGLLDVMAPLDKGSYADATGCQVVDGALRVELSDGTSGTLAPTARLAGFRGDPARPSAVLIEHHHLHVEIEFDPDGEFGRLDAAGIQDVVLESGITTIMDFEDCVAAVDVMDKIEVHRAWLRLMRGSYTARHGGGMNPDRRYTAPDGGHVSLPGRALLFARIVGPLMTTDAILDPEGAEVPEVIVDAVIATLAALHDLRGDTSRGNSRAGAVYLAVPKLHGPDEFAFVDELFGRVERLLGLPEHTVKLGLLDEERRTTVNLAACLEAVRHRVVSTNNGLLDRTGDEIRTSMTAGPVVRKAAMRTQSWQQAYERWHVDTCLAHGLQDRGLIGLGMWPTPGRMRDLFESKSGQLSLGAGMTWVPTAVAATLHAVHYHQVDIAGVQREIAAAGPRHSLDELLRPPVAEAVSDLRTELDAHCYTVLGYAVRWIERAVASSPMPALDGVVVLEDRATLRMSTQMLANWLLHDVITAQDVDDGLRRTAAVLDDRLRDEPGYRPLLPAGEASLAWQAARELIMRGATAPNGYTEPVLYRFRRTHKARTA